MQDTLIFTIAFLIGLLYFRLIFKMIPKYMKKPFTRTKTKLSVHHLHFGIIFVLIGTYVLLAVGKNIAVLILLGYGLGQIFDLFIGSILLPGDRAVELKIYKESLKGTLILAIGIIAIAFLVTYIGQY